MLHSMEGKFYVGSLEVHKPRPNPSASPNPNPSPNTNPNPNPNPSPNPNPNHVPYWEGRRGDIKFPLHNYGGEILCMRPHKISPP